MAPCSIAHCPLKGLSIVSWVGMSNRFPPFSPTQPLAGERNVVSEVKNIFSFNTDPHLILTLEKYLILSSHTQIYTYYLAPYKNCCYHVLNLNICILGVAGPSSYTWKELTSNHCGCHQCCDWSVSRVRRWEAGSVFICLGNRRVYLLSVWSTSKPAAPHPLHWALSWLLTGWPASCEELLLLTWAIGGFI